MQEIAGVQCYVALPPAGVEFAQDTAVLYLGDIFGLGLGPGGQGGPLAYNNPRLLCDAYAANGLACYFPDYLNGDGVPLAAMNAGTVRLPTRSRRLIISPVRHGRLAPPSRYGSNAQGARRRHGRAPYAWDHQICRERVLLRS